ncbi:hypothetical protein MRX96_029157 [Rhipicephalus microplus]
MDRRCRRRRHYTSYTKMLLRTFILKLENGKNQDEDATTRSRAAATIIRAPSPGCAASTSRRFRSLRGSSRARR